MVNFDKLLAFCHDDLNFAVSLAETFVEVSPKTVELIHQAATNSEWLTLREHAHQFKPSLIVFGIEQMLADFILLQELVRKPVGDAQYQEVLLYTIKIKELHQKALQQIQAWINENKNEQSSL